ncbi:MAG: YbhB/YbcL family Raf kinase inhibitor-like protein [Polyangiales bacterium]
MAITTRVRWLVCSAVVAVSAGCGGDSGSGGGAGTGATGGAGSAAAGTGGASGASGASGAAGSTTGGAGAGGAAAGSGAGAGGAGAGGAAAGSGAGAGAGGAAGGSGAAGAAAGSSAGGTGGGAAGGGAGSGAGGTFTLTSTAVDGSGKLAAKHRCTPPLGGDTGPSPAFTWTGAPAGTQSFALLMRDVTLNGIEHWTIYDIPASTTSLPEGVPEGATPASPAGAKQGPNSGFLPGPGYYGPCGDSGENSYEFTLHALSAATLANPGSTAASIEAAVEAASIGNAKLTAKSGP